jgi:hypothetical protein
MVGMAVLPTGSSRRPVSESSAAAHAAWLPAWPADEDSEEELEGMDTAQDSPLAVADLVQRSLTRQDRALLLQQQRQQAGAGFASSRGRSSGGSAAGASSSVGSSGGSVELPASKEQRFTREVDRLLAKASSALAPHHQQQQETQTQQQADQRFAPLNASTSASSLFGTGSGPSSSSRLGMGGSGGEGAAAGTSGSGSGSSGGSSSPTVSELMSLFEESPLFRGGPVPGVQVLHRR